MSLRTLLIISSSGLVLFSRQFTDGVRQPRLVGSLIRALVELSVQTVSLPVSYLELSNLCVAIASNEFGFAYCVLVYDKVDGDEDGTSAEFGQLIASRALESFLDEFVDAVTGSVAHSLKAYQGFQYRVPTIVRECAHHVLGFFLEGSGQPVLLAALVTDDSVIKVVAAPGEDVDEVAMLSHIRPLVTAARDLLSIVGDVPQSLTVSGDEPSEAPKQSELPSPASADSRSKPGMSVGATVTLWRLESATLVVKARSVGGAAALATAVSKPLRLLRKLCVVMGSLRGAESSTAFGGPPTLEAVLGED